MPVWVVSLLLAMVSLSSVPMSASPQSALSTVRGGKAAHLLRTAWRHAVRQKLPAVLMVSGALMLTAPVVAQEQARVHTETVQALDDTETAAETRTFSWVITATMRGTVANMHVQAIETREEVRIAGQIKPTRKGIKYFGHRPVSEYRTDRSYAIRDGAYDGITLPLRLGWSAVARREEIASISTLVEMLADNEAVLLRMGKNMYQDFAKLHIAASDDYRFDNLAEQIEIKFAGKKFVDRHKVRREINKRQRELITKQITYKRRRRGVQLDQDVLVTADEAYHAVLDARQPSSSLVAAELKLNFAARAASDKDFHTLVHSLARLKQAKLLLAREILRLYEPFTVPFLYSIGIREQLKVSIFADDRKRKNATFRYEMRTTAKNHPDEFTLGHISFDHNLHIKHMWLSLKPRGDVPGFAKLTFTPFSPPTD